MNQKVALVTGASSGIGMEAARELAAEGFIVYGAARRVDRMSPLADAGIRTLEMDVTREESMKAGVAEIIEKEGRIDVLVHRRDHEARVRAEHLVAKLRWQIAS